MPFKVSSGISNKLFWPRKEINSLLDPILSSKARFRLEFWVSGF